MSQYTRAELVQRLPRSRRFTRLPPPDLSSWYGPNLFFGVETFKRHMTDEAWQLQAGLADNGYRLCGRFLAEDDVDVTAMIRRFLPSTAILQDKREWDAARPGCFDKRVAFRRTRALPSMSGTFRLTVHKDLQNDPDYNYAFHREWAPHAWIIYYHPDTAMRLCPWLRPEHLIRVHHMLDRNKVPAFSADRPRHCLLSGRLQTKTYPLRTRVAEWAASGRISHTEVLQHPGYHANGSHTDEYLRTLSQFKVAICTASIYGYTLRKLIEATACGCVVITDLPVDDVMPGIDGNLIRVRPDISHRELVDIIRGAVYDYDPERQQHFAQVAVTAYDYRVQCAQLAARIAELRAAWNKSVSPLKPGPIRRTVIRRRS